MRLKYEHASEHRFMKDLDEAQRGKQTAVASVETSYADALRRARARTEEVFFFLFFRRILYTWGKQTAVASVETSYADAPRRARGPHRGGIFL